MTDYKNIRVPEDVHADLQDEKRDGETWGGCFRRLLDSEREVELQFDEEQIANEIASQDTKLRKQMLKQERNRLQNLRLDVDYDHMREIVREETRGAIEELRR